MIPKYTIEYTSSLRTHKPVNHYSTDDPVACEDFVGELLEHGCRIQKISHEGLELSPKDFDKMVKTAAGMLASRKICASLGIKTEEEHHRFGFAA